MKLLKTIESRVVEVYVPRRKRGSPAEQPGLCPDVENTPGGV
jgi:hypothetical protein